jgi:hypothetical protein
MTNPEHVHYWDKNLVYTLCIRLPNSSEAPKCTDDPDRVTCEKCRRELRRLRLRRVA